MTTILEANKNHIDELTPLFDQYRMFYKQESDQAGARKFLQERIRKGESVIFLAYLEDKAVGFTQLFTSFSSVSLQPVFILNDLYVSKAQRGLGVGEALLNRAKELCRERTYKGLALETGIENPAQQLYEKLDWKKDTDCFHYFWSSELA